MILQLDPPLFLKTPRGRAVAHFLIDYGIENDLYWICFCHETGECWTFSNTEIRIENNQTIGRQVLPSKPALPSQPLQPQSQPHQSQPLQPLPPSVEAVFRSQSDTDPLRLRS